jgi:phage-related protein
MSTSVVIGTTDVETLGLTLLADSRYTLIPGPRLDKVYILNRHGCSLVYKGLKPYTVTLRFNLYNDDPTPLYEAYKTLFKQLIKLTTGTFDFYFTDEPSVIYSAKYSGRATIREYITDGIIELPLKIC